MNEKFNIYVFSHTLFFFVRLPSTSEIEHGLAHTSTTDACMRKPARENKRASAPERDVPESRSCCLVLPELTDDVDDHVKHRKAMFFFVLVASKSRCANGSTRLRSALRGSARDSLGTRSNRNCCLVRRSGPSQVCASGRLIQARQGPPAESLANSNRQRCAMYLLLGEDRTADHPANMGAGIERVATR